MLSRLSWLQNEEDLQQVLLLETYDRLTRNPVLQGSHSLSRIALEFQKTKNSYEDSLVEVRYPDNTSITTQLFFKSTLLILLAVVIST